MATAGRKQDERPVEPDAIPTYERDLECDINLCITLVNLATLDPADRGTGVARRRLLRAESLLDGRVPESDPLRRTIEHRLALLDSR